jgi:ABC-type multidrug transport system fused ATPase/permease subunit
MRKLIEFRKQIGLDGHWGWFLASFPAISLLEVVGVGLVPLFFAAVIDPDAASRIPFVGRWLGGSLAGHVVALGLWLVAFFAAKNAALALITFLQSRYVARCQADLSTRLLAIYLRQPYNFHLQRNSSELVRNATGVTFNVFTGVVQPACTMATDALFVALVAAVLFAAAPLATLVAVAVLGAVSAGFYIVFRRRVRALGQEHLACSAEMMKWLNQALGGVKEVKIFGRESFFVERYHAQIAAFSRSYLWFMAISSLPRYFLETLFVGAAALALVLVAQGGAAQAALPKLVLFGVAAIRLMPSFIRMVNAAGMIRFNMQAVDAVRTELAQDVPPAQWREAPRRRMLRTLELEQLTYTYPAALRPALANVSLALPRGELMALVGRSGAGKSTLVDILIGLHAPDSGRVLVDGADIHDDLRAWQRSIGYVPQHIFLTDDSLARNVAFGVPDAEIDAAGVRRALAAAQLEGFLAGLPQGLDTRMGERGALLSGGERQRIGIARALYHDPDVLVLDEATAALDRPTEAEIVRLLQALAGSRTIVLIAHSMATVRVCHKVVMLAGGRVVAAGPYAELSAANRSFQELADVA